MTHYCEEVNGKCVDKEEHGGLTIIQWGGLWFAFGFTMGILISIIRDCAAHYRASSEDMANGENDRDLEASSNYLPGTPRDIEARAHYAPDTFGDIEADVKNAPGTPTGSVPPPYSPIEPPLAHSQWHHSGSG